MQTRRTRLIHAAAASAAYSLQVANREIRVPGGPTRPPARRHRRPPGRRSAKGWPTSACSRPPPADVAGTTLRPNRLATRTTSRSRRRRWCRRCTITGRTIRPNSTGRPSKRNSWCPTVTCRRVACKPCKHKIINNNNDNNDITHISTFGWSCLKKKKNFKNSNTWREISESPDPPLGRRNLRPLFRCVR